MSIYYLSTFIQIYFITEQPMLQHYYSKKVHHNQISSWDHHNKVHIQDTQDHVWGDIPGVFMFKIFIRMRLLSSCFFLSSSYNLAILSSASSFALVFFFNSSSCSWRTAKPYFSASCSRRSASSPADGDFEEGVHMSAFFKNMLLDLLCNRTLKKPSFKNHRCSTSPGAVMYP